MSRQLVKNRILQKESCSVSPWNSVHCEYTHCTFHHDLGQGALKSYQPEDGRNFTTYILTDEMFESDQVRNARERFVHTAEVFLKAAECESPLFVRWTHYWQPPDESADLVHDCISKYRGNSDFSLLYLNSKDVADVYSELTDPIQDITVFHPRAASCLLLERKGRNGDQSNAFEGDDSSWDKLLDFAIEELVRH